MRIVKLLLFGVLAIIVVTVLIGMLVPTPSPSAATDPPTASPSAPPSITAPDLYRAYAENEIAAEQQYKGQQFLVTGVIQTIGTDIVGSPYVAFVTSEQGIATVQAMFDRNKAGTLTGLRKGRTATVRCTVDGKLMNLILRNCDLW